jgi:hypothetical protein
MADKIIHRYTSLASVIHLLKRGKITFLDPASWDDSNDAYFMAQYKAREKLKTVLALCFSEADETYHHWRVFSQGDSGVRMTFNKPALVSQFKAAGFMSGRVNYKKINDATKAPKPAVQGLPFLKRFPYRDEQEFRIVYTNREKTLKACDVDIDLDCILELKLSPWMPEALRDSTRDILRAIVHPRKLRITRSQLVSYARWKELANP